MTGILARVECDGDRPFTAGLFFINNKVASWAPILKHMAGWDGHQVKAYCDKLGWKIERVKHRYDVISD
jgi:hypothetical protein